MAKRELFRGDYLKDVVIDEGSRDAVLNYASGSHHFTGIMRIKTGVIYLGLMRGEGADKYNSTEPQKIETARKENDQTLMVCAGKTLFSFTHNNTGGGTGHEGLCRHVVGQLGGDSNESEFCGFALRFEGLKQGVQGIHGRPPAHLAPTSRSLNPGYNGTLEETMYEAVRAALIPLVEQAGFRLLRATAGADAQSSNAAKASGGKASAQAVTAKRSVFASLLTSVKKIN